jgi:RNA polymerase sigma-70 factor (ECF subfamily)
MRDGAPADGEAVAHAVDPDRRENNSETPERQYLRAEAAAMVHGALDRLSPSHRQALSLRELDGESYQEIAEIVHCPVGTIMSRLFHARRRLAEELAGADRGAVTVAV